MTPFCFTQAPHALPFYALRAGHPISSLTAVSGVAHRAGCLRPCSTLLDTLGCTPMPTSVSSIIRNEWTTSTKRFWLQTTSSMMAALRSTNPSVDWKTSISVGHSTASNLTAPCKLAPFTSPKFPTCLLHIEAELQKSKDFKISKAKTNAAGACSLAFTRCAELAQAMSEPILRRLNLLLADVGLPQVTLKVLQDIIDDIEEAKHDIFHDTSVGSTIAAGMFNHGVTELHNKAMACSSEKDIKKAFPHSPLRQQCGETPCP
jgi:hypothetical protein